MAATCSVSEPLKNGLDDTSTPLLRVEIHDHSGRSYHAARTIPAGTTILEVDTPYAYTIWKPFRNEVCAECWRYDGGRRSFLTRKDDEGVSEESAEGLGGGALPSNGQERPGVGAEEARRQKEGDKDKDGGFRLEDLGQTELSRENVDRAWEMVAQKERSPKEVRKWRNIQLDHFETDVARYVLIALVHRHREAHGEMDWERGRQMQAGEDIIDRSSVQDDTNTIVQFGGARWKDFAALQSNELRHLNAYPELLENQIRAYQALKGRFSSSHIRASTSERRTGSTDRRGEAQLAGGDQQRHNAQPLHIGQGDIGASRDFGSMVAIDNVRGAFRVDPGNSFGIWETPMTDESELMGFAVYPKPSFFNHRE
ncbi:hypothetical protein EVJ58_g8416 [Rhodofomes roseus]|uniref:Uncharacterized protein n=1 Tax=Rhodofomes roseus TaxID=34475 RepID=A0A4Y9Y0C5_9APHY|nr:hypothetical protein EVJ58_g8416 [Rhodofomes roseus]